MFGNGIMNILFFRVVYAACWLFLFFAEHYVHTREESNVMWFAP